MSKRDAMWRRIEEEFGEPIADVIIGLREVDGGNSWRTVAGCLGCSISTLYLWRRDLGLPLDQAENVYDDSSRSGFTPTDIKAQALGYDDAAAAIRDMRLSQSMTVNQIAAKLGCHVSSVVRHTPDGVKGTYNRSDRWWEVRREQCRIMTEENRARRAHDKNDHVWNGYNRLVFRSRGACNDG